MLRTHRRAIRAVALGAGAGLALALVPGGTALAAPPKQACENRTNVTVQALLACVNADGAVEHLQALQAIADANGGNRAAGTPGYEASVDYVVDTLEAAGWDVSIDEFPFTYVGPSTLQQLTPVEADYPTGPYTGSGPGDVTAAVTPVDLQLGLANTSTSGCQAADFAGFPGRHHRAHPARRVRFRRQGGQRRRRPALRASSSSTRATPPRRTARS